MIFKVMYQESRTAAPLREDTKSLYIEAASIPEAREQISNNTPYIIEYIEELSQAHLEYEQENNPDFKVLTF